MAKQKTKSIADIQAQQERIAKLVSERGGRNADATTRARGQRAFETANRYIDNIAKNNKRVNAITKRVARLETKGFGSMAEYHAKKGRDIQATRRQYMGLSKG